MKRQGPSQDAVCSHWSFTAGHSVPSRVAAFPNEIPYNVWVGNGTLYPLLLALGSYLEQDACLHLSVFICAPY